MDLKAGDVVVLRSGGQPLTVAEVNDQNVECVWIGEEGELFRETLPAVTLELAQIETEEEGEEEEAENGEDEEEEEGDEKDGKRAVA
jgi:uncharacterized protein YodC (DUF2158 family)